MNGSNTLYFLLLLMASILDIRHRKIPNGICVAILCVAILKRFSLENSLSSVFYGLLLVSPFLVEVICKEESFGGGDLKLIFSIGCYEQDLLFTAFFLLSVFVFLTVYFRIKRKSISLAPVVFGVVGIFHIIKGGLF